MIDTQPVIGVKRPNVMAISFLSPPTTAPIPDRRSFNYRELDPYLSYDQEVDYQQCESIWLDVMRKVGGTNGSDSSTLYPTKPTLQQFEALRRLLDQRSHLKLKVLPSSKKNVRLQEGYTKFSPKENLPVISFYLPEPSDPVDIANSFATLSHEFVHALHFNHSSIQPREKRANFDLCTGRLETLIEQYNNAKPNWPNIFHQDNIVQYEINRLPVKSLSAMKLKLMTEAIAYRLASPADTRASFDRRMSEGYMAAIRFVNSSLDAKQNAQHCLLQPSKRRRLLVSNPSKLAKSERIPTKPTVTTDNTNLNHGKGLQFSTINNLPGFGTSEAYYRNLDPKLSDA